MREPASADKIGEIRAIDELVFSMQSFFYNM